MTEQERELDLEVADLRQENRALRQRIALLEAEIESRAKAVSDLYGIKEWDNHFYQEGWDSAIDRAEQVLQVRDKV